MDKGNPFYIVIFPCAGEAAASYMNWQEKFSSPVITLEYPGHGTRLAEDCVSDMDELSGLLFQELCGMLPANARVILYGHSMGGILACLTAQKLEYQSQIQPVCLMLSSCGFKDGVGNSTDAVINYLIQSGKISDKVKCSPWFEKYILPVLRNDISMMHQYNFNSFISCCFFSIPVYALYGVDDLLLDEGTMNHLRKITKGPFQLIPFAGAHFFMDEKGNVEKFFHLLSEIVNRGW